MRKLSSLFILIFLAGTIFAQKKDPLSLDPSQVEWFKEAKFGMFIHWGLYAELEGSYNGKTMPDKTMKNANSWYAEWIQTRMDIPGEEYQKLARRFNPVKFDADQWILEAKNAGVRYFVITSKHHDGFALWDSKVSDYDIMNTPYKKDILAALVKACKKHGMKYGFYYSHWQDWEHPGGAMPVWMPPIRSEEDFEIYWQKKCLPQVKELLSKFDPDLLWFDTWEDPNHINAKRRDELIYLIRQNSSKCLINGRISFLDPGENIDFLEMHDNSYPDKILEKPWQTPATMTNSWGWHAKDYNWKSSSQMIGYLANNASKGGNYLLNIGPKPDGSFPVPAVQRLREIGAWVYTNGEAIYGTKPVKKEVETEIYLTQKQESGENILYIILKKETEKINLDINPSTVIDCKVVGTNMDVSFSKKGNGIEIDIPKILMRDCTIPVLKLQLSTPVL